jgi:hypothetical protein
MRAVMRTKIMWVTVLLVTLLIAGYTLYSSSIQYFECRASEYGFETYEEDGVNDKHHVSAPITMKVKKYLLGYHYTIDNYRKEDCDLHEETLMCHRDRSYIQLNLATGKVEISEKYELNKKKIEEYKFGWVCKGVERVVK